MILLPSELTQIATSAITLVLPYIIDSGKEVAKGVAKEVGKDIYTKIKYLFKGDKTSEGVLAQFETNPNDSGKEALIRQLALALTNKPEEAQALTTIINNYNLSQKVSIQSRDNTQTTIIQHQSITGIDPEKYVDVLLTLKEVRNELEVLGKEKTQLLETQLLSEAEANRLKAELEQERKKGGFEKEFNDKLTALDAKRDYEGVDKLLEELDKQQNRDNAKTKYQRAGYAHLQLKFKDAAIFYEQAIGLDPDNPLYLNDAGGMLSMLGKYHEAISLFEKSLTLYLNRYNGKNLYTAAVQSNIATTYGKLGDYSFALELFEDCLQTYNQNLSRR